MARRSRSRHRSGSRKPLIIAILLIVLLSGWFWQRARHDKTETQPPAISDTAMGGQTQSQALPLPPIESTSPGSPPPVPAATTPASIGDAAPASDTLPAFLPAEARTTLRLIAQGGPFPHRQDGSVFGNREGHLPTRPRGYYREYTVDTPGLEQRGARRIVTGGRPPTEYYYTDDHYESFRRFEPPRTQVTP